MDTFIVWLSGTALSVTLQDAAGWLWPICETLHFIGLTLVIGVAGFYDLRLLGAMKQIPLKAAHDLMPWAVVGFALNLGTGMVFLVSEPEQATFLVIAGLNVVVFERLIGPRGPAVGEGDDTPWSFKIAGLVSLVCWFAVLYFGRMLPYIQPGLNSNL
jgi:hypothetical protein